MMTSYELSRIWFDWTFENPEKIKPSHTALFFWIIEQANRMGWKEKFGLPTLHSMELLGIKSKNTYYSSLKDLVDWGFIIIIEKSKNQNSANIISISAASNFKSADKSALDSALIQHVSRQVNSTCVSGGNIDKPINKETNKPLNKVYSTEVHDTYDFCVQLFDEELKPQDSKTENKWLDEIDKLNRIDKVDFEIIKSVVQKTRADSFWSKNFQSLLKLRKNDKDGIKYFTRFYNTFKPTIPQYDTMRLRELYPDA